MTALDTKLAEAVADGLRGLTLYPTQDGRWQANATYDGLGWRCETDVDPAAAVRRALVKSGIAKDTIDEGIFG